MVPVSNTHLGRTNFFRLSPRYRQNFSTFTIFDHSSEIPVPNLNFLGKKNFFSRPWLFHMVRLFASANPTFGEIFHFWPNLDFFIWSEIFFTQTNFRSTFHNQTMVAIIFAFLLKTRFLSKKKFFFPTLTFSYGRDFFMSPSMNPTYRAHHMNFIRFRLFSKILTLWFL